MTNRSLFTLIAVIALSAIAQPHEAKAAVPGRPCAEVGTTSMSDNQDTRLACLYNQSHNLVWMEMTHTHDNASSAAQPRWQGWYAGGDVGLADTTDSYNSLRLTTAENLHTYGGTAGLVGGYNQVSSNGLFYGAEADINYVSNAESVHNGGETIKSVWHEYATARGRLGMAFDPALVFVTGGLALADVGDSYNSNSPGAIYGFSHTRIEAGWVAGAGAEVALTDTISMSAQYLMMGMPQRSEEATGVNSGNSASYKFLLTDSANILRVGVNWHFD